MPVLVGAATSTKSGKQGVAFVLDLTERKQAEAEARESERRYREMQMELAHANRVATMGQLTASIAHEVNQPIAAMVTKRAGGAALAERQPPHLEEAQAGACPHRQGRQSRRRMSSAASVSSSRRRRHGRTGVDDKRGDPRGDCAHPRRSGKDRRLGADATRGGLAAAFTAIGSNCNR